MTVIVGIMMIAGAIVGALEGRMLGGIGANNTGDIARVIVADGAIRT